jgi:hypothetical protein
MLFLSYSTVIVVYRPDENRPRRHDVTTSTDDEKHFLKSGHWFCDNHAQPIRTGYRRPISLRLSGASKFVAGFSWLAARQWLRPCAPALPAVDRATSRDTRAGR